MYYAENYVCSVLSFVLKSIEYLFIVPAFYRGQNQEMKKTTNFLGAT